MKIKLNELISEAHGKMCKRDGAPIFAFNRAYGKAYVYHTHKVNPRNENPTDAQVAVRQKFRATWSALKTKRANPTEWAAIKEGFKNQSKYKTILNYAFAVIYPTVS